MFCNWLSCMQDIENILYSEVDSEPSTTSLRRGSQSVQADTQKVFSSVYKFSMHVQWKIEILHD